MKIKLFVKYISLLVLLFVVDGCKEKKADTYVTKVTDLTGEEEQVLKLEYDRDGKIIKLSLIHILFFCLWQVGHTSCRNISYGVLQ